MKMGGNDEWREENGILKGNQGPRCITSHSDDSSPPSVRQDAIKEKWNSLQMTVKFTEPRRLWLQSAGGPRWVRTCHHIMAGGNKEGGVCWADGIVASIYNRVRAGKKLQGKKKKQLNF